MPEIKFESEWLKINDNVKEGDTIQFLDAGKLVEDDNGDRWLFNVAVLRGGELVEPSKKFNLNKGNFAEVSKLYGTNSDAWVQKEMKVTKIKQNNPKTGQRVDSIALEAPDVK